VDEFLAAVPQHRLPVGRRQVPYPVGIRAQHGDQVALTAVVGDDHREGDRAVFRPVISRVAARDGMTPAENMTADSRFSTRPKRLGRPPRYSQRR